ncbi:MAG: hypothetical protein H0W96_01325 [Solirubrobacterales bacterium]|nr:hypothetical protein [Solirubrobacterales bacterium]
MSRPAFRITPLAVAALSAGILALPSAGGAATTTTCKLTASKARSLGPTYVADTQGRPRFRVRATTCANGVLVIKSFHACRLKKGKEGRCTTRVRGYSCTDRRPSSLKLPGVSFEGDVTCSRGDARVIHHYQQNL